MSRRKTDKWRLIEGRGLGEGPNYQPWLRAHEVPSRGRTSRPLGWKYHRSYEFLSDLEFRFFLLLQYDSEIIDIREQFPLLPVDQTKQIAEELQLIHPPKSRKDKIVMTTDFLLTIRGEPIKYKAIAIKSKEDLTNPRTIEKLCIEEQYWKVKEIPFSIVTEADIDVIKAKNLEIMYPYYWWDTDMGYSTKKVVQLVEYFKSLIKNNSNIREVLNMVEDKYKWTKNMGINFLYYMITHKDIEIDLSKKIDIANIKVEIKS